MFTVHKTVESREMTSTRKIARIREIGARAGVEKKFGEARLRWLGHVEKTIGEDVVTITRKTETIGNQKIALPDILVT